MSDFKTDPTYDVIEKTGLALFGLFNVVVVLVSLNILIAMLNTSYSKITVGQVLLSISRDKYCPARMERKMTGNP